MRIHFRTLFDHNLDDDQDLLGKLFGERTLALLAAHTPPPVETYDLPPAPGSSPSSRGAPAAPETASVVSMPSPEPAKPEYLERIAVEMRGQVRVVPVAEIDFITASEPYAEIHAGEKTYLIRERMQTLEERLDPARFFRIHRSVIVRLELIDTLLRAAGGDYAVRLKSGVRLKVSRSRIEDLEKRMGVTH